MKIKKLKSPSKYNTKAMLIWAGVFAAIGIITLLITRAATPGATMSITPATGSYAVGSTITISVTEDSGSSAVNAVESDISYPANLLQFTSATAGSSPFTLYNKDSSTPGVLKFTSGTTTTATGSQKVVDITFTVLASGSAPVSFATSSVVVQPVDDGNGNVTPTPITSARTGATYTLGTVTPPSGTATMTLTPATGSYAVGSTITMSVNENSGTANVNAVESDITYPANLLQFKSVSSGTSPFTLYAQDTATAGKLKLTSGTTTTSSGNQKVVDITFTVLAAGTAAVTFDATSNVIQPVDNGSGTITPTPIVQTRNNASFSLSAPSTGTGTMTLTPASGSYVVGSTVTVSVNENSGTAAVNAVQSDINYPANMLQFKSVSSGTSPFTLYTQDTATPGSLKLTSGTTTTATGSQKVVDITFTVIAAGTAPVTFATTSNVIQPVAGSGGSTVPTPIVSTRTGASYTLTALSSASATMTITPATGTYTVGSTITVTVNENSGTANVNAVQSDINFPSNLLQFKSASAGTSPFTLYTQDTATAGKLKLTSGTTTTAAGNQKVVDITFTVLAAGTAPVTFATTSNVIQPVAGSGGSTIPTPIVSTRTGASYTLTAIPNGSASMTITPATGSHVVGSTFTVSVTENSGTAAVNAVQSDINYPANMLQFKSASAGTSPFTLYNQDTATAGRLKLTSGTSSTTTGSQKVVDITFTVLAAGTAPVTFAITSDVIQPITDGNGVVTPISIANTRTGASYTLTSLPIGTASMTITPASGTYAAGNTFTVSVNENSGTANINAVQSDITYPSNLLQFKSVSAGTSPFTLYSQDTSTAGLLKFTSGTTTTSNGSQKVVDITFTVLAGGTAPVALASTSNVIQPVTDGGGNVVPVAIANSRTGASYTLTGAVPPPDTTNPTVSIAAPVANAVLSGTTTTINVTANDNVGVSKVEFYMDGTLLGTDTAAPFMFTPLNTTLYPNGNHSLTAKAFDAKNNTATSSAVAITINNATVDNTPPSIVITSPAINATISGSAYLISVLATDASGVSNVQIKIDGGPVLGNDVTSPFSFALDTTKLANGNHSITILAFDNNGNPATATVPVKVNNLIITPISCDFNADRHVDIHDLVTLLTHYATNVTAKANGDCTGNGVVDLFDLVALFGIYGTV